MSRGTDYFPDFSFENQLENKIVAGVDEAGRGPLAGPVVASAVIIPRDFPMDTGLNDSKKLNEKKRNELFDIIHEKALAIGIGIVHNERIDEINILQATQEAMHMAIRELTPIPEFLFIDGNYFRDIQIPFKTIVKGDSRSLSIAAASIIAKVTRDRWMSETAEQEYPGYLFAKHKGYGTKQHYQMIDKYGVCPIHRRTFLKRILNDEPRLF